MRPALEGVCGAGTPNLTALREFGCFPYFLSFLVDAVLIPEGSEAPNLPQRRTWPRGNVTVAHPSCPQSPGAGGAAAAPGWDSRARSQIPALPELLSLGATRTGPNPAPSPAKPHVLCGHLGAEDPPTPPVRPPGAPMSHPQRPGRGHHSARGLLLGLVCTVPGWGCRSGWGGLPTPWLRARGACPAAAAAAAGLPSA